MRRTWLHIFLFLLFFCPAAVFAQDVEPEADSVRSVFEVSPMQDSDTLVFQLAVPPPAVQVRSVPQKRVDSLKAAEDFWYANAVPEKKKEPAEKEQKRKTGFFQQPWVGNLLWMIVLTGFIGVVLWYLQASNIFLFRKKAKKIVDAAVMEEEEDDLFTRSYDREIAKAEAEQNFRLAVRLRYLQTLKNLADRQLIDYRYGRTNSDYVTQLFKTSYYQNFFRLTRNFEYTWYGQFEPSAEAYEMMRRDFSTFQNGLRR